MPCHLLTCQAIERLGPGAWIMEPTFSLESLTQTSQNFHKNNPPFASFAIFAIFETLK